MKFKFYVLLGTFFFTIGNVKADEGMWMLNMIKQLNMSDMKELGFQLSAEDIYDINNSSLKDAIVIFGGGCTAEVVSEEGLLFTNHHCGFDEIQNHSTLEHDYLTDGFWAKNKSEELPNPELEVRFLIGIENVTKRILIELSDEMADVDRQIKVAELIDEIEDEASENNTYEAVVKSFYEGNEYYLFVYQVYKDVRLVGTPPSSIGKFGHDTDNWMWPRHTGDFSIFRIYTAPDGKPAEYSPDNIPMKPKYHLPISLDGYKEGDFTFVMGFPGSTDRYLSSFGIKETMEVTNEIRKKVRGVRKEILQEDMQADPEIRIKYATKYSRSNNYWKYSIGQNKGLKHLRIIEEKQREEQEFMKWVESDSLRKIKYENTLDQIEELYMLKRNCTYNYRYISEALFRASEIFDLIKRFQVINLLLDNDELGDTALNSEIAILREYIDEFFKEYNAPTDKKVVRAMLKLYRKNIPENQLPTFYFTIIDKKFKGDIDRFVDELFEKSFFVKKSQVEEFLDKPNKKALKKDLGFLATRSIFSRQYAEFYALNGFNDELEKYERLYMQGLMEKYPERRFYPDANSTMRLTYGVVDDYFPADAIHYDYYTTLKGVMEKEDPDNFEFIVPPKLKDLYNNKDYGVYGDSIMIVNFITNNDITGGNSGSPVLNAKGQLIGLAFDGNWEAMSGDIKFEPNIQRCIVLDIRYLLFIVDKYAAAENLIRELDIVN